jgi:hypothetical protein
MSDTNNKRLGFLRTKRARNVLLFLVVVTALGFLVAEDEQSVDVFDPASTEDYGTKALALLADELGSDFEVGSLPGENDVALLLSDTLNQTETDEVEEWIDDGGTLVVADLQSSFVLPFAVPSGEVGGNQAELAPQCEAGFVEGVGEINPSEFGRYTPLQPTAGSEPLSQCFQVGDSHFALELSQGQGRTIILGSPDLFTNDRIDEADNSVLAANLLNLGEGSVTFLRTDATSPDEVGAGEESLADLLPDEAIAAMLQLLIAGAIFIVWKWRRHGEPLQESSQLHLPGSALVVAASDLMQSSGRDNHAASMLRNDLRSGLIRRFGLAPDVSNGSLAEVVSQRSGLEFQEVLSALQSKKVENGEQLIALARQIEYLNQEVTSGRR